MTSFLALVLVDVRADAAFDAPKRIVVIAGITVACVTALLGRGLSFQWPDGSLSTRLSAACLAGALLLCVLSAAMSARPAVSGDALRTMFAFLPVMWICASPVISAAAWHSIGAGFLAGALVNAAIAMAQFTGIAQPFRYATEGGRGNYSALIGNSGMCGLVLAFASVLILPKVIETRGSRRVAWVVALFGLAGGIAINRSVTAAIVILVGIIVFATRLRQVQRFRWVAFAAVALLIASVAMRLAIQDVRSLDDLLSYRFGPWAAAVEMVRERPLLGMGPGTYAAEYAPHLVAAETRWSTDFGYAHLAASYAQAHNDYLQALAEVGIAGACLIFVAAGITIAVGWRAAEHVEEAALVGLLAGAAAAALMWFPMQRPETALLLLAAFGRAWRIAR